MGSKAPALGIATSVQWVETVIEQFDTFLADHANCERKASALAMGLVAKYPDREAILPLLIHVAREELEHFDDVYALMRQRGVALTQPSQDAYVNALGDHMRHGRDARLMDRLLVASIVEARGAERFGLVAEHHCDAQLADFYARLHRSEVKHGHVFMHMALSCFDESEVADRSIELARLEADILVNLPIRPALH
jgi:tRNA-(ms[2]io[6]A)-hydroxylase